MEYAMPICDSVCDNNFYKHVGWEENNSCIRKYFSSDNIKSLSYKITQLLQGVDPHGRPITVPDKTICHVLSEVFNSYRPPTGDIYSRYIVPTGEPDNYVQSMIDQTIEIITSDVKNNIGMEENNRKLSVWTTVLGDFNANGLRQHAPIKIREKNTNHRGMVSFMNY
jgi:hypothetical protein